MFVKSDGSFGKKLDNGQVRFMDREEIAYKLENDQNLEETDGKEMTCEDYCQFLENHHYFDNSIQEARQTRETSGISVKLMQRMIDAANKQNVFLTDIQDFDFQTHFTKMNEAFQL